ncbi:hypothetical protein J3E68DRAFT_438784 [Trichoderma sp. SZMC 28012]
MARSVYEDLPLTSPRSIRILKLDSLSAPQIDTTCNPDEALIQLSLRVVNLDDNPSYNALSYTWGPPSREAASRGINSTPTCRIKCNGESILVTQNLFDCLQQFTHGNRGNDMEFWIDAICIHQGSEEQNQQVNLMADIYRQAKKVTIWLGKADEHTDQACVFIEKFAKSCKIHLELLEVYPSSWWDKKKGMISPMDSDAAAINRILMRCRYSKKESPDFLFILELNQPGSNAKHLFHTAICHRDTPLLELAEYFHPELPNISGYASNGMFNMSITLDPEDGGDRMSLTPGEAPDSHDTINASLETEKLAGVSKFKKLLGSRKQEKAKEESLRIDIEGRGTRLQFVKDQRQMVDDEIKKLEARRMMLVEEEQEKTGEMNELAEKQRQARKSQDDLFRDLEVAHQRLRSVQPIEYSEVDLNDFAVDENNSEAQRKDEDVGRTLLRETIKNGDVEVMKILLAGSADEDAVSTYGWLVLISAAFRGDADTVGGLLATNKIDPDSRDKRASRTALSWASENGHADVVKLLLNTNKHEDIVKLLLETRGIDVNLQAVYGYSPLHLSARSGYEAIVQLLLKKPEVTVNLRDCHKCTPLHYATSAGYEAVVKLLLDVDVVDVNAKDDNMNTPLHLAAIEGHETVAHLLLGRAEVDVNAKNQYDNTALHLAAFMGYEAIASLILRENDVGIDKENNKGRTSLHLAAIKGQSSIVKLLIDTNRMDFNSKDSEARTPLHYASAEGFADVAKMLLDTNRVDVNVPDIDGATPLHLASGTGQTSLVKLLIDRPDIDLDPQDSNGRTPLQRASDRGWVYARQLLLNRGAINQFQRSLQGHGKTVQGVAFSHDSKLIVSGSLDFTVKIWDRFTGRCQKTLEGHNGGVNAVAFSHDSTLIASASNDSTIRVWNTTTGQCQLLLNDLRPDITVHAVAFSHDSKLIISGSSDAIFKVWDATTGELLRSLTGPTIYAVAFSHNSDLMISGSDVGTVILWNDVEQSRKTLRTNIGSIYSVAFSKDSMYFYTASADGIVRSWSTANLQCQQEFRGHGAPASSVAISPASPTTIASGSFDETIKIWNADTGMDTHTFTFKGAAIHAIAFSHDSDFVVTGSSDSTVRIWDMWLAMYAASIKPRRVEEQGEERRLESGNQTVQDRIPMRAPMDGDRGLGHDERPMGFGNNTSPQYNNSFSGNNMNNTIPRNMFPMNMTPNNDMAPINMSPNNNIALRNMSPSNDMDLRNMSPNNDMAPRNMTQRIMSPINSMGPMNDLEPMNGMVPRNSMLPNMFTVNDAPPVNRTYMNNMAPRSMTPMTDMPLMNNMSTMDQNFQNNVMQSRMVRSAQNSPGPGMQNWQ